MVDVVLDVLLSGRRRQLKSSGNIAQSQREQVDAVAMDMWQAYMNPPKQRHLMQHRAYKFHIAATLNEAVDQVRRRENKH